MNKYLPSIVLIVPFFLCMIILLATYNLNEEVKLIPHVFISLTLILFLDFFLNRFFSRKDLVSIRFDKPVRSENYIILILFSSVIIGLGIIDLFYHGLVILNPSTYDKFSPLQAWIRYFSSLSWILVPVALFLKPRVYQRFIFIGWAFLFPVLIVDRNRLFMAVFSFLLSMLFIKFRRKISSLTITLACLFVVLTAVIVFSKIGNLKNSALAETYEASNLIPGNKKCDFAPTYLPVKDTFKVLPETFQWIFLYGITPLYNLSVQHACEIRDSSLLKAQLIPFWKRSNSIGSPYLVASNMNVGTEILPFFLSFGLAAIYFCFISAFVINRFFYVRYLESKSIFDLLIFFRLSYCSVMFGFAPQYFIYTNLGFIIVMVVLKRVSSSKVFVERISLFQYMLNKSN